MNKRLVILYGYAVTLATLCQTPCAFADEHRSGISLERYIGVDRRGWPDAGNSAPRPLSDLYSRLEIDTPNGQSGSFDGADVDERNYQRDKRPAIFRLLSGLTHSVLASADTELKNPELEISVPMFNISHTSDRGSGETFISDLTASQATAPLFRIEANTSLTIHLHADAKDQAAPDSAPLIIKAVQKAIGIAAPSAALLTSFSKEDLNNEARALDTVIGALSSEEITEDIHLGRLIDTWTPNAVVFVQGIVPSKYVAVDKENSPHDEFDKTVGTWRIKLSCPRPSYFDARDLCHYSHGEFIPVIVAAKQFRESVKDIYSDETLNFIRNINNDNLKASTLKLLTRLQEDYKKQDLDDLYNSAVDLTIDANALDVNGPVDDDRGGFSDEIITLDK